MQLPNFEKGAMGLMIVALFIAPGCDEANVTSGLGESSKSVSSPSADLEQAGAPVPGQYIVVFKEDVSDASELAKRLVALRGGKLQFTYEHTIKGFAAKLSDQAVKALRHHAKVAYVEQDREISADEVEEDATWGLDRSDQRANNRNDVYVYNATGAGVHAYIIDSGIRTSHNEFGDRASVGYDAINDGRNGQDCSGHGTHVAATVGGRTWGVAKEVKLVSVRVLGCDGRGTFSEIIAGVEWVTVNHKKPAVANMSLGADASLASRSLETAVRESILSGVQYAISAGNNSGDACNHTPARVPEAMTVGATNKNDEKASFSNYGECVDWFAPGVGITSAGISNDKATSAKSGTSMSAPHTAGVAALHLEDHPLAVPKQVRDALYDAVTLNVVQASRTPNNHLLYSLLDGVENNTTPAADFSYEVVDQEVDFTDQSSDADGRIVGWSWNFGDGTTSTAEHPFHTYKNGGTHTVILTVTDNNGATTRSKPQEVVVNQAPVAEFSRGAEGRTVYFRDQSRDEDGEVVAWEWKFGDGERSTAQHPAHTYDKQGTYSVTLTVTDDSGKETNLVKEVGIISLSASGYKVRGYHRTDLTWSGTSSGNVEIYRNNVLLKLTGNDGSYTDATGEKGAASYTYQVCEEGTDICSNEATVTF